MLELMRLDTVLCLVASFTLMRFYIKAIQTEPSIISTYTNYTLTEDCLAMLMLKVYEDIRRYSAQETAMLPPAYQN